MNEPTISSSLNNYSQLNELHCTLFLPKPFNEFEYRLFNNELDVCKINIEQLFTEKNEDALIAISNYESIYSEYSDLYITCMNYLVRLESSVGFLKLGNYTCNVKLDKDTAIKLFKYGGNKGNSRCFYNIAVVYFNDKKYVEAIQMLDEAIKLNNTVPEFHILYATIYEILNDRSNLFKQVYLAIKSGEGSKIALACFETSFESNDLYQILLRVKMPNLMIRQKIIELSRRIDNIYYQEVVIKLDDNTILRHDFEEL